MTRHRRLSSNRLYGGFPSIGLAPISTIFVSREGRRSSARFICRQKVRLRPQDAGRSYSARWRRFSSSRTATPSSPYNTFGVDPPESETRNGPCASNACVIHSASGTGNISMRPIVPLMGLVPRRTKDEGLHRFGKTFIIVGSGDGRGLRLDLVRSITHGDAEA